MKIITFEEFIEQPVGTVFSYYEPTVCRGLYIKHESLIHEDVTSDYFEESLVPNCWNGDHPSVGEGISRWGMFDHDQQYVIYEKVDVATLLELLSNS